MSVRPELVGRKEMPVGCKDQRGRVELNEDGVPVVFRWVCRNRACCPRREGFVAVHRMTLFGVQNNRGVGEYVTDYEPTRPMMELIDSLDPKQVGRE